MVRTSGVYSSTKRCIWAYENKNIITEWTEPERNYFYAHAGKILKTVPRITSKIGAAATLKGNNLLPEGANSSL